MAVKEPAVRPTAITAVRRDGVVCLRHLVDAAWVTELRDMAEAMLAA